MKKKHIIIPSAVLLLMLVFLAGYLTGSLKGNSEGEASPVPTEAITLVPTEAITLVPTEAVTPVPTEAITPVPTKAASITVKEGLATPANSGALKVVGSRLCNSKGEPVQLRGISTHGLAWFPDYVNNDLFRQFREDWNVNVMRLAMYTHEYGGYCSGGNKDALRRLIRNGVKYATDNDMYVIIDWHVLNDRDPNTYKSEAKAFFKEMSEEFASHNNVLYEICNEPNGGVSWSSIKSYAEEIIPVIRGNDPDAIIIVGTPTWSQEVDKAAADPISDYDNIMYALHFYAATHRDWLRTTMKNAVNAGLPVFVTEYGICDASGNGSLDINEANKWVSVMNECGISYINWSLSNKAESASIIKAGCSKLSGLTENDLTESGKWLYKMLTGKTELPKPSNTPTPTPGGSDSGNTSGTEDPTQTPTPTLAPAKPLTGGDLNVTAEIVNSWQSGSDYFYQYSLGLENISDKQGSGWEFSLKFNEAFHFESGWNAGFLADGKTLALSSGEYNGTLAPGGRVSDIGFIISGSSKLKLK